MNGPARPQQAELGRDRLLDLDDHVGAAPDVGGLGDDLGAGRAIGLVGDAAALAGAGLHQHAVAGVDERLRARRHHADAVLADLHFLRDTDDHDTPIL